MQTQIVLKNDLKVDLEKSEFERDLEDLLKILKDGTTDCITLDFSFLKASYDAFDKDDQAFNNEAFKTTLNNRIKDAKKTIISFFENVLKYKNKILEIRINFSFLAFDTNLGIFDGTNADDEFIDDYCRDVDEIFIECLNFICQCKNLKVLFLENFKKPFCEDNREEFQKLCNFIKESNLKSISHFNYAEEVMCDQILDCELLLGAISESGSIQQVSVSRNFGKYENPDPDEMRLNNAFRAMLRNPNLQKIRFISTCEITQGASSFQTLFETMCEENSSIVHLYLDSDDGFTLEKNKQFVEMIQFKIFNNKCNPLKTLVMKNMSLLLDHLKFLVPSSNQQPSDNLKVLDLSGSTLCRADCEPLISLLKALPALIKIDIRKVECKNLFRGELRDHRHDGFDVNIIKSIAQIYKNNKTLTELGLDLYGDPKNPKDTSESQKALATLLKENKTIRHLNLGTSISLDYKILFEALLESNIQTLTFSNIPKNNHFWSDLLYLIKENPAIHQFMIVRPKRPELEERDLDDYEDLILEDLSDEDEYCKKIALNEKVKEEIIKQLDYNRRVGPASTFLMGLDSKYGKDSPINLLNEAGKACDYLSAIIFAYQGLIDPEAQILRFDKQSSKAMMGCTSMSLTSVNDMSISHSSMSDSDDESSVSQSYSSNNANACSINNISLRNSNSSGYYNGNNNAGQNSNALMSSSSMSDSEVHSSLSNSETPLSISNDNGSDMLSFSTSSMQFSESSSASRKRRLPDESQISQNNVSNSSNTSSNSGNNGIDHSGNGNSNNNGVTIKKRRLE